jgi:hypothetical protein
MATDRQRMGGIFIKKVTPEAKNPRALNEGGDQTDLMEMHAIRPQEPLIKISALVTPAQ